MFSTGLIVFRESLEAALFVGIVAASSRGVPRRTWWLALGVLAGVLGSLVMAAGMGRVTAWAEGMGQDLLTVLILSVALLMLAWHCIWVSAHAREMAQEAQRLGSQAAGQQRELWVLATAVALAVLREGAETVLFVAGVVSSSETGIGGHVLGAGVGLALGVGLGSMVYAGLGRLSTQGVFGATHVLLLLLAGSLASQLVKALNQADLVSAWSDTAWDISAWLPNDGALGTLLHGLVGYDASPSWLQVVANVATVLLIGLGTRVMKARVGRQAAHGAATVSLQTH